MSSRKSATGSVPKITPGRMEIVLDECYTGNIPPMFWGPPGVGKSDCVRSFAQKKGLGCIDIRLSQYDPVDLRGVPRVETMVQRLDALRAILDMTSQEHVDERIKIADQIHALRKAIMERGNTVVTQWASPSFFPMPERDGERGILFLDEITSADGQVQAAAYQLVLDRRLGDYKLPNGWLVVAAGNRPEDRAVVKDMSSALANRFCHFEVTHDFKDWVDWAFKQHVDPRVIAYHRYKEGSSLYRFDPTSNDKAFPTPRSWERVSDALRHNHGTIPTDVIHGCVGIGEGVEFEAFCDLRDHMPDPEAILKEACEGKKPELPFLNKEIKIKKYKKTKDEEGNLVVSEVSYEFDGACMLYMLLTAIAMKTSEKTVGGIWNLIDQLSDDKHHGDYAVRFLIDCLRVNSQLVAGFEEKKRMKAWCKGNLDLVDSLKNASMPD